MITRTPINPTTWSAKLGFDQGQLIEGHTRQLVVSGQDAVDADGQAKHAGDMAAQLEMSLDNLDAILSGAGMSFGNVVRLNVYSTDVGELFTHWGAVQNRFGDAENRFVTSVLGVTQLAAPGLLVLLEATAAA
jgi:enamine deaminase RidA (YjgF/YER057c/UK114 family)